MQAVRKRLIASRNDAGMRVEVHWRCFGSWQVPNDAVGVVERAMVTNCFNNSGLLGLLLNLFSIRSRARENTRLPAHSGSHVGYVVLNVRSGASAELKAGNLTVPTGGASSGSWPGEGAAGEPMAGKVTTAGGGGWEGRGALVVAGVGFDGLASPSLSSSRWRARLCVAAGVWVGAGVCFFLGGDDCIHARYTREGREQATVNDTGSFNHGHE